MTQCTGFSMCPKSLRANGRELKLAMLGVIEEGSYTSLDLLDVEL